MNKRCFYQWLHTRGFTVMKDLWVHDILIQNSVTVKEVTVKMRLVFKSKMYVNQGKCKEVTLQA